MTNWGRLGVFDLETTGIDVDTSRIVSACIAVLDEHGEVVKRWDWLADPGIDIPEGASAVHGITTERARAEGRPAVQVVGEIAQTLRVLFALGMPVGREDAPRVKSLRIEPAEKMLAVRSTQSLKVTAVYSDGHEVDVTRHARFQTNREAIATVDESGLVTTRDVAGDVAIMAA